MQRIGIIEIVTSDASENRCGADCPQAFMLLDRVRCCLLTRRTQGVDSPRNLECCDAEAKMATFVENSRRRPDLLAAIELTGGATA